MLFRRSKIYIIFTMCAMIVAVAYASIMVVRQQNQLQQAGRYNIAWAAGRTINEYLRFEKELYSFHLNQEDVDIDRVQMRLDILHSRVGILVNGDFAEFTKQIPEAGTTVNLLVQAVDDAQNIVDHLDRANAITKAISIFQPLDSRLEALAGAAYQYSGDRVADDQHQLFRLTWQFASTAIGLFLCGFLLFGLLWWHNKLLSRTQTALKESAVGLEQANLEVLAVAQHDGLTGLVNRSSFHKRLDTALRKASVNDLSISMFYLDFDDFKDVNDSMGHPVGDAVLKEVGARFHNLIVGNDTVARLGGDEFGFFITDVADQIACDELARNVISELSRPYLVEGIELTLGVSVGIAKSPQDGTNADELTKSADMALYVAKSQGKKTYKFFEAQMAQRRRERLALQADLHLALERGELCLYYQPIVRVEQLQIVGFEALLRWKHASKGFVSPADFIPIAEESGHIHAIGEWVIREACSQAQTWPSNMSVSINISSVQFRRKGLIDYIKLSLSATNLNPSRLIIEITESVMLARNDEIMSTLRELKKLGIKIAMDDFGTGYSSLSYLTSFPFDVIKIDRAFVREISHREDCVTIVRSIASLGKDLHMTTTAEGVETLSEFEQVAAAGCNQIQGYLFGRPQPADLLQFEIAALPSLAVAAE